MSDAGDVSLAFGGCEAAPVVFLPLLDTSFPGGRFDEVRHSMRSFKSSVWLRRCSCAATVVGAVAQQLALVAVRQGPVDQAQQVVVPSGYCVRSTFGLALGDGCASLAMPTSTKPLAGSPPGLSTRHCSPTEGGDQVRTLPARRSNQGSQSVTRPPEATRTRAASWSTAWMVPGRRRFSRRRSSSMGVAGEA